MARKNRKNKQIEKPMHINNSSKSFTNISSRNAFIDKYDVEKFKNVYSSETISHIESYELNIACLNSCQEEIQKMFSLGNSAEDKRFPKEYKRYFLSKALTIALPIVLAVGTAILSTKAGGFSEMLNSATWSSFGTALGTGGILGVFFGSIDYTLNRIFNTEEKINKTANKRLAKRSKKDMKRVKFVTPLEYIHKKVMERKAIISKQRNIIRDNLSSIIAGDTSCFLEENGKLKKDFKVLPLSNRIGLKRILKEINERNIELDELQRIIPMQIESDKKTVTNSPVSTNKSLDHNIEKEISTKVSKIKDKKSSSPQGR